MPDITERVRHFQDKISRSYNCIQQLQSLCTHPRGTLNKDHKANTGNYDPSSDCYWTEFHCEICDKKWHEDGSK